MEINMVSRTFRLGNNELGTTYSIEKKSQILLPRHWTTYRNPKLSFLGSTIRNLSDGSHRRTCDCFYFILMDSIKQDSSKKQDYLDCNLRNRYWTSVI